jgi:hypothetical protein
VEAPPQEENTFANTSNDDRHHWTYDQTLYLIDAMGSHMDELNHPKKRRFVFNNISNDLLSSGFSISGSICQNKWKNLLRSYKVAKDTKNRTGRGPSRFHFFDKMDDLLGEKPSNKCSHSLESSSLDNLEDQFPVALNEPSSSTSTSTSEPPMAAPRKRRRNNATMSKDDFFYNENRTTQEKTGDA